MTSFSSHKTSNLNIPKRLIHGTVTSGAFLIHKHGIQARGFSPLGKQRPAQSLDFGEGFYCSYDNKICRQQVNLRA